MSEPASPTPRPKKPLVVWIRHVAGLVLWYSGDVLDALLDLAEARIPGFADSAVDTKLTVLALRLFAASRRVDVCERWAAETDPS